MKLLNRLHFLHRAWRYRLRSEPLGVQYVLRAGIEGGTAIDVGANHGVYSYWMHHAVGPGGKVYAFEPQPDLAAELDELKQGFRLRKLVIEPLALSATTGESILRRPKHHWGGGSLELAADAQLEEHPIRTLRLDDYFYDCPHRPISLIKCDIEGHEAAMFAGAERILLEDRPRLLFESFLLFERDYPLLSLLERAGYQGYCLTRGGLQPLERYPQLAPAFSKESRSNFVFLPEKRARLAA